jgi:hypothetical protein
MGMRKLAVLCMLVGSLVITGALPVTAASHTGSQTVNVNAFADYNGNSNPPSGDPNSVWTNTGFTLKAGLPVAITASGTANRGSGSTGPAGNGFPCPQSCTGPGLSIGSLIGRIGTGPVFVVGVGPTTVSGDGTLYLAFNDGWYNDNSGFFTATISYDCQPGNGFGDENHYHCGPPGQA